MAGEHLTGTYRVRATYPAFQDVNRLVRSTKQKIEVRRHALKLRYWPTQNNVDDSGQLVDLDWSWIRSLPNMQTGELRIRDDIGGNDNLRIIFFVGDSAVRDPLPLIWILRVLQKKRDDFSPQEVAIIKARRTLVLERFYRNPLK
jgi:hypothetical protein